MHFSPAVLTLLSLGLANTATAVPLRSTANGHQNPQAVLAARAFPAAQDHIIQHLAARDQVPEAVHKALKQLNTRQTDVMQQASVVVARYAHMPQSDERTRLVVRDLERRGILDQLISSLKELVDTLLGQRVSQPPSKRQAGNVGSVVQEILCLLQQLLGNGTDQCNSDDDAAPTSSAGAKKSKATKGASKASSSNSTSVDDDDDKPASASLVPEDQMTSATATGTASSSSASATAEKKQKDSEKSGKGKQAAASSSADSSPSPNATGSAQAAAATGNSTSTDSTAQSATGSDDGPSAASATLARQTNTQLDRRDAMDLAPRQSGVTGLLTVLRMLLDALLNTLLPMSTRSEDPSSSASAQSAAVTGKDCPPPGTPNDGQYRPGCPGYGRRDLGERDTIGDLLDTVMPIVESLISALTNQDGVGAATAGASKSAATSTDDSDAAPSSSKNKTFSRRMASCTASRTCKREASKRWPS
ncbi:hypothetical protein IE81DRAFT_80476 [Ceraceosorus guamensis]|uniref:Uncharacterized protein n=1 Tax=Ceraceosorus guamensis TaxID=1522189 RepID=A0A316W863_9BASI|nr:hypothetical protein IE81DRAFT_80476 [Ceraceosorus guamensis]PWN46022.1 hypothetical protein IE81DRAFT_80476 [Ceraceosorus guamensis]